MNASFFSSLFEKLKHFLRRLRAASLPVLVVSGFLAVLLIIGLVNRFGITNSAPRATVAGTPTVFAGAEGIFRPARSGPRLFYHFRSKARRRFFSPLPKAGSPRRATRGS